MATNTTSHYPRRGNALTAAIGRVFLRACGWRLVNTIPEVNKGVVIGGPHTSNWDGVFTLFAMLSMRLDARLMIKDSAFKGPMGPLLRWLGALPIDRKKAAGVVDQTVAQFDQRQQLIMVLAPEGTRSGVTEWKTGFYRIAHRAQVPILVATADYAKKEIRFAPPIYTSGDLDADMRAILEVFRGVTARHPERLSAPLAALARGETQSPKSE